METAGSSDTSIHINPDNTAPDARRQQSSITILLLRWFIPVVFEIYN